MLIWAIEDPTRYHQRAKYIQRQILELIFIPPRFAFLKFICILRLKIKQTWVLSKKKKKILGFLLAFRIHLYSSSDLDAFDFQVAVIMLERLKEADREWKKRPQKLREKP